ncbi:hypothetical protein [Solicola sp. PLA-1-18]|uniref:hypothetical protein n=1 Tax=Solicola sp. PLA-1-18 TaxID=3380532 RepID=UPI003B77379A
MRRALGATPTGVLALAVGVGVGVWANLFRPLPEALTAGVLAASLLVAVVVLGRIRSLPDDVDELTVRVRAARRRAAWTQPALSVTASLLLVAGLATTTLLWLAGAALLALMRVLWWEEYRTARRLQDVRPPFAHPPV